LAKPFHNLAGQNSLTPD